MGEARREEAAAEVAARQYRRPLEVVYRPPATIAFWPDGTKSVARCHRDDTFSRHVGFLVCVGKHYFGSGTELRRALQIADADGECREGGAR